MAFRLQRVARVRARQRELRSSELQERRARLSQLEAELVDTRAAGDRYLREEAQRAKGGSLDEATFRFGRSWVRALGRREADLTVAIEDARTAVEEKRLELVDARREEQKLERLEERHEARARDEELRRTQEGLDEFSLQARLRVAEG